MHSFHYRMSARVWITRYHALMKHVGAQLRLAAPSALQAYCVAPPPHVVARSRRAAARDALSIIQ